MVYFVVQQAVSVGSKTFGAQNQLLYRLLKGGIFTALLTILVVLFMVGNLTFIDLFVSALAFLPSGWALLQVMATHSIHIMNS